jgi:type IV pilus assembly protein PilA
MTNKDGNSGNLGFSLLELMVVLIITSVLLATAIPSYQTYLVKARVLDGLRLLEPYKFKVIEYYLEVGKFPAKAGDIFAGNSNLTVNNPNIESLHYHFNQTEVALAAKLKNPPSPGKEYIYLTGKVDGVFVTWVCGASGKTDGIEASYYPHACK